MKNKKINNISEQFSAATAGRLVHSQVTSPPPPVTRIPAAKRLLSRFLLNLTCNNNISEQFSAATAGRPEHSQVTSPSPVTQIPAAKRLLPRALLDLTCNNNIFARQQLGG